VIRAASAVVVDDPDLGPGDLLAVTLERSGAWTALGETAATAGIVPRELPIVIVPDLSGFAAGSPAATDPTLVESLIDRLWEADYRRVVIGVSAASSALWAENRDVYALADILGYRFVTPAGHGYDIADLSEDLTPGAFGPGDVLAGTRLSRIWTEARFRILFAKNKTDEADGYALGLSTLLGVLPLVDKDYYYRLMAHPGDVVAEVLRATPVDLCLIDAIVSCHGSGGGRAPRAIPTHCIIASTSTWLADRVGAIKMGLDPATSSLATRSPALGDAVDPTILGSLDPYDGWINAHPLILDSTAKRDASPTWSRLVRPWLQVLDATAFPLKSPLDARMNERLAPLFANVDDDPAAAAVLVFGNYMLANLHQMAASYRTLYDKDKLRRIQVPLGFDTAAIETSAYDAIVPELVALERLLEGAPEEMPGLRWRYLDEAVLFDYRRELSIDFDQFVASVDVAKTIQYMNDYIGGVVVPVEVDESGQVVRQAERNIYLPQPNYLVLSGGKPIDVAKLEVVEYASDVHRMYWKTIESPNGSAIHDDGSVTFRRTERGTDVTIFGRQLFVLPPFWQSVNLALVPELKRRLVTDAYSTFFDRTLANFAALVEGRDIRIGRSWRQPDVPTATELLPAAELERLGKDALGWLQSSTAIVGEPERWGRGRQEPLRIDEDGFAHFAAPQTDARTQQISEPRSPFLAGAVEFWKGLLEAGLRDVRGLSETGPP
jgi:uncharacterized protein (DUF362 family)